MSCLVYVEMGDVQELIATAGDGRHLHGNLQLLYWVQSQVLDLCVRHKTGTHTQFSQLLYTT